MAPVISVKQKGLPRQQPFPNKEKTSRYLN